jgi:hypothetical protein
LAACFSTAAIGTASRSSPDARLGDAAYYGKRMAAGGEFYGSMWWGSLRADGGHDFFAVGNHGQL